MVIFEREGLTFNEEEHKYTVNGKELKSVTTLIDELFPEFDADKKAGDMSAKSGKDKEVILAEWKATADEGTLVHKEIENYIKSAVRPTHSKALMARYWCQTNTFQDTLHSEVRVFSEGLGIAGTIDLVVEKPHCPYLKPRVTLVDWKTNAKIYKACFGKGGKGVISHIADCNYNKYNLQLSIYAYILEMEYGVIVDGLKLVHLVDGEYVVYEMDYLKQTVRSILGG
jgi:ATP-dependent exoDNAse (exonuclease V) beta subunit